MGQTAVNQHPAQLASTASRPRQPAQSFRSPLAAMAGAFAFGILWVQASPPAIGTRWFLPVAASCILLGLILLRAGWNRCAVTLVLASMVFAGAADTKRWEQRFPVNHIRFVESRGADLKGSIRLEGRVVSEPYRSGYGTQFDVEARSVESRGRVLAVIGKVRLRVEGSEITDKVGNPLPIRYGDDIRTVVRLRRPQTYQNPGSFDFRQWMEDIEDVHWVGTVKSFRLVQITGHPTRFDPGEYIAIARRRLLRGIDDLYPPWTLDGRYGAVLKAVLWGDRTALDSSTIDDFRKTGLYHLLVIAGLHVGLIALLVEFFLRALEFRRATRAVLVLGFLSVYACLVEQRAATIRATLMIALYLVARVISRDHSPLNSLGGVALLLLFFRPAWLMDSGFQLSFGAALLIVAIAVPILSRTTEPYRRALWRLDDVLLDDYFSPRLAQLRLDLRSVVQSLRQRVRLFCRFPTLARIIIAVPLRAVVWVANMLIFSAILQLGLLLPMVETFHRVAFAGVGLNALAIPLMTVLLAIALPVDLLSVVSPMLAVWPAKLLKLLILLLFAMTHLPTLAPWLSYRIPAPPAWVAWGFCASFALAALALRFAQRRGGAALAICAIFVAMVAVDPFAPRLPHGEMELTALDCGPGDALFLVLPDGTTVLLDAGGSRTRGLVEGGFQGRHWDSGEDIVSPYLWSRGVKKIDVVALTRGTADYAGGMFSILQNFRIGEFWHPPQLETPEYAALLNEVATRGIPTRTLMAGDALPIDGASIQVLWPKPDPPSEQSPGDASLILRVSAGEINLLLSGSAGKQAEDGVAAGDKPLDSQVLTTTDQGPKSEKSNAFVTRVAPSVVVISPQAGSGPIELPNPDALDAIKLQGARIFRTDIDGATTIEGKDGSRLIVRIYTSPHALVIRIPKAPSRPPQSSDRSR